MTTSLKTPVQKYLPYIALVLWAILICGWVYLYMVQNISLEDMIFWAKAYVLENPLQGITFFILLYIVRPLFFIVATPFDLFSGMVFGPVYGFILSIVSCFFSGMFSYWVGRVTGPGLLSLSRKKKNAKKVSSKKQQFHQKLQEETFMSVLLVRSVMFPFDLSNYIFGILRVPFWKYLAATTLWIAPATFVIVSAGSAFYGKNITDFETLTQNIQYENLWFASVFLIILLLFARILKRYSKNITLSPE